MRGFWRGGSLRFRGGDGIGRKGSGEDWVGR